MKMTLEYLIAEHKFGKHCPHAWLTVRNVKAYVRVTRRFVEGMYEECLDVASVEVIERHRGRGVFTRWLENAERLASENGLVVYVESILEPRLLDFLGRRGYKRIKDSKPPCVFLKVVNK